MHNRLTQNCKGSREESQLAIALVTGMWYARYHMMDCNAPL